MPKALFFNVPAHGHVNPSLPLVEELTQRGHHVIYFLTDGFRSKVEAAGAEFRPYSRIKDDFFSGEGLDGSRPMLAARYLMDATADVLPELIEIAQTENPDYILFDGMCPWGQLLPKIIGVPGVASLSLPPAGSIRQMMHWDVLRSMVPMMVKDFGAGQEAGKRAKEVAHQYNVPSLGMMGVMNGLGDLSISYLSEYFYGDTNAVPSSVKFVGRVMEDTLQDPAFPLSLAGTRRIVYVSLGSLINDNVDFFKACIEAFTGADEYVIMSTGRGISPQSFGKLPENIVIYDWVPQLDVLKKASLFITHGGLGSISDGVYFGLPLLLVPQQDEQLLNARRAAERGVGLILKKSQISAQAIREHARRLLDEVKFREEAAKVSATMREAGGVKRAADEIDAMLAKKR